MNWTPASSKAFLIASNVVKWLPGTPSADSNLNMLENPTPDFLDKSVLDQFSKALAARIWALVIKFF
jgi:hypothetical protein